MGRVNWRLAEAIWPRGAEDIQPLMMVARPEGIAPEETDQTIGGHKEGRIPAALATLDDPFLVGSGVRPILAQSQQAARAGAEALENEESHDEDDCQPTPGQEQVEGEPGPETGWG
jgi:hypothetical protein